MARRSGAGATLALLLCGCVTVRGGSKPVASPWPPPSAAPRPTLALVVAGEAPTDSFGVDLAPALPRWRDAIEGAYRESDLLADLADGLGPADINVHVRTHAERRRPRALTVLAQTTLFIVPTVTTTEIIMETDVSTAAGTRLSSTRTSGIGRTWSEVLLLPATAFFRPENVTPPIVYDLARASICELYRQGAFTVTATSPM